MVTWVILAGLPASGKSTLAEALAGRLHAAILGKDRIREALFPGALTDYTNEQDNLCMRAVLEAASYLTAQARVDFVLFDGRSFSRKRQREEVVRVAEKAGARWRVLHVWCAEQVAKERLIHPDPTHPAHNRNLELYQKILGEFEPIAEPKWDVDTSRGLEDQMERVLAYLTSADT